MAKSSKAYFGLPWIVSLILAILPTNLILGIVTRAMRGNLIGVLLNIFLAPIAYIVDIVTIIIHKDLTIFA